MKLALITLSKEGAELLGRLAHNIGDTELFVHRSVEWPGGEPFDSIVELTSEVFNRYRGLIYAAPCGVVVRAIAPCLAHKTVDPAVVVMDVLGRHAVSLVSGHEGGANGLALLISNLIGSEPVITTTSEAIRRIVVGIGCRRGTPGSVIARAIEEAALLAGVKMTEVRWIASIDLKSDEQGLIEAAHELGIPLRLIPSREIGACLREFTRSKFVEEKVGVPAVAEPAALLAGRRTTLILPKTILNGVSVAVAREDSL